MKDRNDLHGISHQLIIDMVIGFVVSGIVAFFVVKWLLRFVQSHTFNGFATYRVLLGGGLLIALYTHAVPDVGGKEQNAPDPIVAPAASASSDPAASLAPAVNTGASPATTTTDSAITNAAPSEPVYPRAQAVDPADLTNSSPATNVTILPPPSTPASAPETNTPATNNVPASQN